MTPFETVSIGDLSKRRPIIADSRFGQRIAKCPCGLHELR